MNWEKHKFAKKISTELTFVHCFTFSGFIFWWYLWYLSIWWFQYFLKPFPLIFWDALNKMMNLCQPARTYAVKYLTRYLAKKMQCAAWPTCESKQAKNMWQLDPPGSRINRGNCDKVRQEDWPQEWFHVPQLVASINVSFSVGWGAWLENKPVPCFGNEWETPKKFGQNLEWTFECSTLYAYTTSVKHTLP